MKKILSNFLTALFSISIMIMSSQSHAGMVTTPSLLAQDFNPNELAHSRQQIIEQLVELGVEKEMAITRVAGMTDQQISELTQKIEELPAGADTGGVLLALFIIFVITDAMGVTDIFPFIHPAR